MVTPRSGLRLYLSAMVTFALMALNWRYPLFAWSEAISGACTQVVVWFLPWVALVGVLRESRVSRQSLGAIALSPLLLFSFIAIPWSIADVGRAMEYGKNVEFAPIAEIAVPDGSRLVTYLSDCGFVCAPVAVLRHERTIFGPLSIVHLVAADNGETLRVHLVDDRHVEVQGRTFTLRRFLVF